MTFKDVLMHCDFEFQPASKDQITAIIEKAKANLPAKPTKTKKSASAKAAAAPVSMDDMDDEPKAAPSRPLSTASSEGGTETKAETKTRTVRGKAKAVSDPVTFHGGWNQERRSRVENVQFFFVTHDRSYSEIFVTFTGPSTQQEKEN